MRKLPYIKDKALYAAVMGACSYVRETGYFNKATSYYANKYDVDVEEVRKLVRIAQGNGQRGTTRNYKWYVILALEDYVHIDYCGTCIFEKWSLSEKIERTTIFVRKSTTRKNAINALSEAYDDTDFLHCSGRCLSFPFVKEFESKKEANEFRKTITKEFIEKLYTRKKEGME